jgi:hypothetical protein
VDFRNACLPSQLFSFSQLFNKFLKAQLSFSQPGGPFMGLSVLAVSCSVLLQLQKPADGTAHVMAQMEAP